MLVGWHNATTSDDLDQPNNCVDEYVADDTSNKTISNRVGEGHNGEGDERGKRISEVKPIDFLSSRCHHRANDNQGATCGPRRDGSKDWSEEDRDEEADTSDHGCDTGLATL